MGNEPLTASISLHYQLSYNLIDTVTLITKQFELQAWKQVFLNPWQMIC